MNIWILGSGTYVPSNRRGSSGYYVDIDGNKILLDCGNGTTWKLEKIGVSYTDIDHIFITHFHPDHTSDLVPFLFANKYPYNKTRSKKLHIWGGKGIEQFLDLLNRTFNNWLITEHVVVSEIDDEGIDFQDFSVESYRSLHTDNSLIYKFITSGMSFIYTGDTDYFDGLEKISVGADIILVECSSVDHKKLKGHLTPSEIIKLANHSGAKKIILTHFYPVCDEVDIIKQIEAEVQSEVIKAEDLMMINT